MDFINKLRYYSGTLGIMLQYVAVSSRTSLYNYHPSTPLISNHHGSPLRYICACSTFMGRLKPLVTLPQLSSRSGFWLTDRGMPV